MNHCAPCTLRTHGRTWRLSQRELPDILGFESPTQVSRIERGKRVPRVESALACSTLFGVPLDELFPQLALKVEEKLFKQISRLREAASHSTTPLDLRKRALLEAALCRVEDGSSDIRA